jgi:hypothetical protein
MNYSLKDIKKPDFKLIEYADLRYFRPRRRYFCLLTGENN